MNLSRDTSAANLMENYSKCLVFIEISQRSKPGNQQLQRVLVLLCHQGHPAQRIQK